MGQLGAWSAVCAWSRIEGLEELGVGARFQREGHGLRSPEEAVLGGRGSRDARLGVR